MVPVLVVAIAMLAASTLASTACAQGAAPSAFDTVELVNGGVLRGTLIVYEPGQTILLQLPTGEVREIAADDVEAVRRGSSAVAPPPPAIPPPPATQSDGLGSALGPAAPQEAPPGPEAASEPVAPSGPTELVSAPVANGGAWGFASASSFRSSSWRDVSGRYRPRGDVHIGVQGGIGLDSVPDSDCARRYYVTSYRCRSFAGANVEIAGFIDLRPNSLSPYRFRAAVVLGLHQTDTGVGLLSARLRVHLLGFDLHEWLVWRLGGDVGMRWYDRTTYESSGGTLGTSPEAALFSIGPTTSLAVTLLDRSLEIGVRHGLAWLLGADNVGGASFSFETSLQVAYLF